MNFTDVNNPFPFDDNLNMETMLEDYMDADFIAVKIGDVNNSASTNLKSEKVSTTRSSKQLSHTRSSTWKLVCMMLLLYLFLKWKIYMDCSLLLIVNDNLVEDVNLASNVLNVSEGNYRKDTKLYVSIHEANSVFVSDDMLDVDHWM